MKCIAHRRDRPNRDEEAVAGFLDLVARLIAKAHYRATAATSVTIAATDGESSSPSAPKVAKLRKQKRNTSKS